MANQEHLDLLTQGVETWNIWRVHHRDIQPNLSEADLSNAYLSSASLTNANLRDADLSGANLMRADLSKVLQWHFQPEQQ